jgi:hypothetical protein
VAIGTTIITVVATDAHGNSTTNTTSLVVVAAQITGSLQLEGFDGSATAHSRSVVFVATTNWISGGVTNTTVLQSWTNTLSNVSGDTFAYTLPGVSPNANGLSAKTAWNLRKKLPITWNGINTAGVVNFTGANLLPGGDIEHVVSDNSIFYPDYSVLGNNWYTTNSVADIDGNGQVDYYDYVIFYGNWFTNGDPQ